jgi:hypothetical protein
LSDEAKTVIRAGLAQVPAACRLTAAIAPLNDTLLTGVAGYHKVSLTQMADETVQLIQKTR